MKTWRKFTIDTQTELTDENAAIRRRATPGIRNLNWYDLSYVGFLIAAVTAIAAGMFC